MKYETIVLQKKMVAGIAARTKNSDPTMPVVISGLWNQFFQGGIYEQIPNKVNQKSLGIYSDYETDYNGAYRIFVGCEIEQAATLPLKDTSFTTIPAGIYAKFIVRGNMQQAVADFWKELWEMNLDRSYVCDFEEYQNNSIEDAEIHIYISLK